MKSFHAKSREEWRKWLEKNHEKEDKVFLIKYKKHTGKPTLSHKESMEEAICFGWIDTTIKRIDDEKYGRNFVKRKDKAGWSKNTLSYAKQLIKQGKMTPAGMKRYKEGLKKGTIDHGFSKNPEAPEELKKELNKNKKAKEFFDKLAPSYKRVYIYSVIRAKMPETRKKRIKIVVERCSEGKKPGLV